MADGRKLLEVRNLSVLFHTPEGTVRAVDRLSFSLGPRETLGVVGESGSGKSVTALAIMRLLPSPPAEVRSDGIIFDGVDISSLPPSQMRDIRGDGIAMVFQDPMSSLNPSLTVGWQIAETVQRHHGLSRAAARRKAVDLLGMVGIAAPEKRVDDYPHQFSGGMRQRVMIAMAISCEPKLLIADEPTTALDVTVQAQILELITRLQEELGMAMILITHDLGVVADMADTINVMYAGRVMETSAAAELFARPSHPYTRGLLASIPRVDGDLPRRLQTIEGTPPILSAKARGCPFAPRCEFAMDRCRQETPPLDPVDAAHVDHRVACWVSFRRGDEFGRTPVEDRIPS